VFRIHVIASSTPPTSPLITLGNVTFFHVRHGALWLVAVCKNVRPKNPHLELKHQPPPLSRADRSKSGLCFAERQRCPGV